MAPRFDAYRDRWNGARAGFDVRHRYLVVDREALDVPFDQRVVQNGLTKDEAEIVAAELNAFADQVGPVAAQPAPEAAPPQFDSLAPRPSVPPAYAAEGLHRVEVFRLGPALYALYVDNRYWGGSSLFPSACARAQQLAAGAFNPDLEVR